MAETAVADATETSSDADVAVAASEAATAPDSTTPETTPAAPKTTTLTGEPPKEEPPKEDATVEPKAPVVPDKYELKLPENSVLDETVSERIAANARTQGLSQEQAQAVLESLNSEVVADRAAFLASMQPGGADWTSRVTEYEENALKDPEIGGTPEKLTASVGIAKKVLADVFPPSVVKFLNESGFGSHPDVIRGLVKIGKMTSEGEVIPGNVHVGSQKSEAELLYDHPSNSDPNYTSNTSPETQT